MNSFLFSALIFFLFIGIGYFSRRLKLLDIEFAKKLMKFLNYTILPYVIFITIASVKIDSKLIFLPFISITISIILMSIAYFVGTFFKFDKKTLGTLIVAAGVTSTISFALPFISYFYGVENSKFVFLYDFGNGLFGWTVVNLIAGKFGNKSHLGFKEAIFTFLKTPMPWALIGGLVFNVIGLKLPEIFTNISQQFSVIINPLILISIGILLQISFFTKSKNILRLIISSLIIIFASFFIALFLVSVLRIEGLPRIVILICAIAPSGSLASIFSNEHDLDTHFASALIAFTTTIALIVSPIIVILFSR